MVKHAAAEVTGCDGEPEADPVVQGVRGATTPMLSHSVDKTGRDGLITFTALSEPER